MHSLLLRRHKFNVVRKQRTQCTTDTHRTHHSCCNCPRLLSPSAPTSHSAAHSNPPSFPLAQTLASGPRRRKRGCDSTRTDYLQREREREIMTLCTQYVRERDNLAEPDPSSRGQKSLGSRLRYKHDRLADCPNGTT